jgi:hypothetical protein
MLGAIRPGNEEAKADASATGDAELVIQIVVLVGTKQSSLPCALKWFTDVAGPIVEIGVGGWENDWDEI